MLTYDQKQKLMRRGFGDRYNEVGCFGAATTPPRTMAPIRAKPKQRKKRKRKSTMKRRGK